MKPAGGCVCGYRVDAEPRVSILDGEIGPARAGDFHVCMGCARVLILDTVDGWRPATITEIFTAAPITRAMLAAVSKATTRAFHRRGRGVGGMVN